MSATTNFPKAELFGPKPDFPALKPEALRDGGIRLICIPAFGLLIPFFSDLYGGYRPDSPIFWAGFLWFQLVSFLIWHGNRYFLIRQRKHYDWFHHPMRKIVVLLFANVFYTAPVSVGMLAAWYRFAGFGPDWNAIRVSTLLCIICVVFVTHVYETVYLIQQRENDLLNFERMERAKVQAELEALKSQLDPHFMFNSLNALSWLIENDTLRALTFNDNLADVYRYILGNKNRTLVQLSEEIEFIRVYFALLQLRFDDAVTLEFHGSGFDRFLLPPISLQILIENAVKHNEFSRQSPLTIHVRMEAGSIVVENARRDKRLARPTAGIGLVNLDERCRLLLGRPIEIRSDGSVFRVRLPIKASG